MRKKFFFFLLFTISTLCGGQEIKHAPIRPMLDSNLVVMNGGIGRLFPWETFDNGDRKEYVKAFKESPYQTTAPIIYNRYGWWKLEGDRNDYKFSEVIDPLLIKAVRQHSRVILGIASMCAEKSDMSHLYKGKWIAVPDYLYEELQHSPYPMHEDIIYCKGEEGFSVDYDSPLVYARFSKMLHAFRKWMGGRLTGTQLRRKDVIYAIEMRHLGYWGEGAIRNSDRPKTNLLSKYIDLYIKEFPQTLLIGGIHSTVNIPNYRGDSLLKYSDEEKSMMFYCYKLLTASNKAGRVGGFVDSWLPNSDQYDEVSQRVLVDENNRVVYLRDVLKNNFWGKVYLTGEFGYFISKDNQRFFPYQKICEQFSSRHVSGLSVHNLTAYHRNDRKQYQLGKQEYNKAKRALSIMGYRFVLDSVKMSMKENKCDISFLLTNIGISRMFHHYHEIHVLMKDPTGKILYDKKLPFDLTCIPETRLTPLEYKPEEGIRINCDIPAHKGKVCLLIKDKYDIEFPLTLSNYGRLNDGSYLLGTIN